MVHPHRALLPAMLEKGRGHLVYISSVLGRKGVPNMAAYSASKAGVAAFGESVAAEVKPQGLKVTIIYPGTTATRMRDHQTERPQTPDITDPEIQLAPGGRRRRDRLGDQRVRPCVSDRRHH